MELDSSFTSILLKPGTCPGSKRALSSVTFMMNFTTGSIVAALKADRVWWTFLVAVSTKR